MHHSRWVSSRQVISPTQRPLRDYTHDSQNTLIPAARFKPTFPAKERPQTHTLDDTSSGVWEEKKSYGTKCVSVSLLLLSKTVLIQRRTERGSINVRSSSCKILVFLSDYNENWIFATNFMKILTYQILRKSL